MAAGRSAVIRCLQTRHTRGRVSGRTTSSREELCAMGRCRLWLSFDVIGINNALLADAAKRRVQKKVSAPQLPQAASKKAQRFQKTRSAPLGSLGNDSAPGSGGAARGSLRDKVARNHQQFLSAMEKSSKLR
eukprot:6213287-Pleurochrysis_carterae.AAC.1